MYSSDLIKKNMVLTISYLYILLFVYAAVSKLLDFENFKVQIGQSPLLSIYAHWVSWWVIILELLTAFILAVSRFRIIGLLAALCLMSMFSAYIFIILHFSSFIPCSCGGILEKMSWNVHLAFNFIFALLAVWAILLEQKREQGITAFKSMKLILPIIVLSIASVTVLFISSEKAIHENNPFIRRYPKHPVEFSSAEQLNHNSYYFAGYANNRIYLGNYMYPAAIISMDQNLRDRKQIKINLDPEKIPFSMVSITVRKQYFYVSDGSVPIILRGDLKTWTIDQTFEGVPYFTKAVPIDSTRTVFRSNNSKGLENVIGIYDLNGIPKVSYNRGLLQKQIDGIFDTDGTLLYSEDVAKAVYLYYYRNEFITADPRGKLIRRGKTIDTVSHAKLKSAVLENGRQHAMSSPSFVVNADATVLKNLLFVYSRVKGRYEDEKLWKRSFIIDLYNINTGAYLFSFPIFQTTSNTLNSFMVTETHLYAIIGNDLVSYQLKSQIKKEIKDIENLPAPVTGKRSKPVEKVDRNTTLN
ncbi:MauE/DoxX family redox-associated membrane protein [Flavobacterium quisquiliarum]|uniref:MauE/DoxX family redox-associated membrane protein n=1 Tax=Flavobacterium quisquiliarum TaxID=1834436 RepID=A0ABV8W1N8_9FLAO|nr:MauE/DoxX family redox-associated membrane protein [Flavobacterium quisquiliarum]MBW1656173.1 hypothetical protein [Flavobacterium quisquiliarum]